MPTLAACYLHIDAHWISALEVHIVAPVGDSVMMRAIKFMGIAALALGLTAKLQAQEAKGTIKSVDDTRKEVILKGTLKDTTYGLTKNASVWLDGFRCKLADLAAD